MTSDVVDSATVVHVYGVVPTGADPELPAGLDGQPVAIRAVGPFDAVVSALDAERFGARAWTEHAEDLPWLQEVATAHHGVLQRVVEQTSVVPLRLPGIHEDMPRRQAALRQAEQGLVAALTLVEGHVEMGLHVFGSGTPEAAAALDSDESARQHARSGRDYLQRKADESHRRSSRPLLEESAADALHQTVAAYSRRAQLHPVQDRAMSGRSEPMLLNASYLVARDEVGPFRENVARLGERLSDQRLTVECTGPWPPYGFVAEAMEAPA
jgi:hypothetical protein